jgi:NAD(P)H-dependent FMN reductase
MFIPIILGTARQARQSEKVARFILEEVKKAGLETELIDVRDYRIEATDNTEEIPQAQKLSPIIEKADGFIIVSPEYNHGYPGELKMFLDMLYDQYARKPLGICGVSIGPLGGGRMVEKLRLVGIELHMVQIREVIYFPFVQNLFDEKGIIKDPGAYGKRVKNFLDELVWYAKALKEAKGNKEG